MDLTVAEKQKQYDEEKVQVKQNTFKGKKLQECCIDKSLKLVERDALGEEAKDVKIIIEAVLPRLNPQLLLWDLDVVSGQLSLLSDKVYVRYCAILKVIKPTAI